MDDMERADHLAAAARKWCSMASLRRTVAAAEGPTLETLGQLLAAADHLERAREKVVEALDLWGKARLADEHEQVESMRRLGQEVVDALGELDREFGEQCVQVASALEAGGEHEDLLEVLELTALDHERLAEGRSLADLHDLLSAPSCSCCCSSE
jgi:hypothetical protein